MILLTTALLGGLVLVENGTADYSSVDGATVVRYSIEEGDGSAPPLSVPVDTLPANDGRALFKGKREGPVGYVTRYLGVEYYSTIAEPYDTVTVTVYETTDNPSAVELTDLTLMFFHDQEGGLEVGEHHQVVVAGDRAYTGVLAPVSLPEGWNGLVYFGDSSDYRLEGDILSLAPPLPPGTTSVVFRYGAPLPLDVNREFPDGVCCVTLQAEEGLVVTGGGLSEAEPVNLGGVMTRTWEAHGVQSLSLVVKKEGGVLFPPFAKGVGIVLAALALAGLLYLLTFHRGHRKEPDEA